MESNIISFLLSFLLCVYLVCCHHFRWLVSQWSKCSTSCGSGWKQRQVSCQQLDARGKVKTLTAAACKRINRPADTERCTANNCPTWVTSPWGKVHSHSELNMVENEHELKKSSYRFILLYPISVFRKVLRPHHECAEEICHLPTCQWLLEHTLCTQGQVHTHAYTLKHDH